MPHIIIKWKEPKWKKSRSEIEKTLRKEGWGTSLSDEQIDKCSYLERKVKDKHGLDKTHIKSTIIDRVK